MRTYRIQIDLSEDRYKEIESLIEECGFSTKKDFFDNAITLLKWTVKQARRGLSIASVNEREKKYTELQMPFLERVQERNAEPAQAENATYTSRSAS
jgi:hypothetical protein